MGVKKISESKGWIQLSDGTWMFDQDVWQSMINGEVIKFIKNKIQTCISCKWKHSELAHARKISMARLGVRNTIAKLNSRR